MNALTIASKDQFFEQLADAFSEKIAKTEAKKIADFARQHYAHIPLEELVSRRFSDTYGAVLAAWQFLQKRSADETPVSVFNPDLESDGWQSTHSVVFILHPNIPFLIDSLRMAINQREIGTHSIQHSILRVERDDNGKLKKLHTTKKASKDASYEAFIVLEIDRHSAPEDLRDLEQTLQKVLHEVRIAVGDFPIVKEKVSEIVKELDATTAGISEEGKEEARAFLSWLVDDHFTFLGYDEYDFAKDKQGMVVRRVENSELGILRVNNERPDRVRLNELPQRTRHEMTRSDDIFIFAKSAQRSRVHRPAYPDYIAVKKFNSKGEVVGERRFLGLYTARVYNERPDEIPLLRRKFQSVMKRSGFLTDDYAGKELEQILTLYPRDELFQIETDELLRVAKNILYIQERRRIELFMREDVYGQFVTCLAFFPRDIYNTELRLKVEQVLLDRLEAEDIEFVTHFSESVLARVQFTIRVPQVENRQLPLAEIRDKVIELAQSWRDGLYEALSEAYGEEQGNELYRVWAGGFPASYTDMFSPRRAAIDLEHITASARDDDLAMSFYRALEEDENTLHFKLFYPDEPLPLSDVMPIFDNLGFRVIGEHPFEVIDRTGKTVWIHDFTLQSHTGNMVDIHRIRPIFEELFRRVWHGEAENDAFNRLLLSSYMSWREIALLRTYARYMRQIRFSNSQTFISNTLVNHVNLTRILLEYFEIRFNPERFKSKGKSEAAQQKLEIEFNAGLDEVENLSEDRVLRLYLELMQATLRTNYYQPDGEGQPKPYISVKFDPSQIPDMPLPLPMFEIFVYSPRVEGVHLRGGKVARGGLRWSDRFEDYRTEILGLVKAQQVKNAVIVPVGAKGGFVAKRLPDPSDREAFQAEGIAAYKTFIRGLLDITDNLVDSGIQPPERVIRHDEDDHYLVVAADKGTATFSDIANGLAAEYGFWMGDAFASGGSNGYDHKKMGITARGAWVSVERHFREMGINPAVDEFTAIGIGDMGGDVFGNGLLCSEKTRLVAAFNHIHIFIDPTPDAERSYKERKRLFELPRSAWTDYDSKLISKGGGVFSRNAKSIPVSPEMKKLLGIKADRVPPNMLISHILKAEVDLLWIGGIGTYVKGSGESHSDVGDKANDGLRINGAELRCRVVGEGGNLGFTQMGRIEYALKGGRLNTDFIDNSGGVDCSDHEVNMKILLNRAVAMGDLTGKQRNIMLEEMTDDVASLVLKNNYRQTQAISIASEDAATRLEEYRRLMNTFESEGKLNRALEFLPDDETLSERKLAKKGLTRPELSVLISYVKGDLKQVLIDSNLPDNPLLAGEMYKVFPRDLTKRFSKELGEHQLRREIIATQIANDMVNHMGITFVERLNQSTGADAASIALAWIIARDVFRIDSWWDKIEALDFHVSADLQMELMQDLMRLMRRAVRWLLRNRRAELNIQSHMERFADSVWAITSGLPEYLGDQARANWEKRNDQLMAAGLPKELASVLAGTGYLYSSLGIIEAQEATGMPLKTVANLYYDLGDRLDLTWFANAIAALTPSSHWQALARESFREDLDWQQRALTTGVLKTAESPEKVTDSVNAWEQRNQHMIDRWNAMLAELKGVREPEYAMFSVALRELLDLAQSTMHQSPEDVTTN
ncbi:MULTISPECIES: NAD-glutamate dehydrogenase [Marinobacter]|uniref:Glutamate dehydrogenase n=1 Tax=Marinobacter nauticus TaxID=2743 RepID=A0A368VBC9_MARNT|nr:NAD-glutamate dehydrogenase [Marinobacter nauticus]MBY5938226.1 NAD-glutamate dehydrogenase [Marinobacter nauticus]MBY5955455.1 NAD-glutamate dehydrogenase [Marinobacter nauticus]MBY6009246.1 NAD-glutamate dehydrogenase [Marinobacter nauticus]RBP77157.1 glutamate dehydrogenase [Marinobacter nauticus]RCW38003.1 glutamate dehydrogenase [Marinobacter nauticus]